MGLNLSRIRFYFEGFFFGKLNMNLSGITRAVATLFFPVSPAIISKERLNYRKRKANSCQGQATGREN